MIPMLLIIVGVFALIAGIRGTHLDVLHAIAPAFKRT